MNIYKIILINDNEKFKMIIILSNYFKCSLSQAKKYYEENIKINKFIEEKLVSCLNKYIKVEFIQTTSENDLQKLFIKLENDVIEINEENLVFSENELKRIELLRKERNYRKCCSYICKEPKEKTDKEKAMFGSSSHLKCGMPVRVNVENNTLIGFISKVNKTNPLTFDIETPGGLLKSVYYKDVWYREIKDYSLVEIPEELKKMNTHSLLNNLKAQSISFIFITKRP